jgi:hypothetical protein
MRLLGHDEDQVDIRLGTDELLLLANTLREMCEGVAVPDPDFHAILGVSRSEAEAVLLRVDGILERLGMVADSG